MRENTEVPRPILRDLGEGLILRQATVGDTEAAAEFPGSGSCAPGRIR